MYKVYRVDACYDESGNISLLRELMCACDIFLVYNLLSIAVGSQFFPLTHIRRQWDRHMHPFISKPVFWAGYRAPVYSEEVLDDSLIVQNNIVGRRA